MTDYTRTASVTLHELTADRSMLPRCHGWKLNGTRCNNVAKYELDGRSVCAVHIKPNAIFVPEKWVRDE